MFIGLIIINFTYKCDFMKLYNKLCEIPLG